MQISVRLISPEGKHSVEIVEAQSLDEASENAMRGKVGQWLCVTQEHFCPTLLAPDGGYAPAKNH
jgi:hypothetical protein